MPTRPSRRKRPRNDGFQDAGYEFQSAPRQPSVAQSIGLLAKELAKLIMHMLLHVVYPTTEAYEQRGQKTGGFFGSRFDGESSGPGGEGDNPEMSIEWAYKTLNLEKGCTLDEARASFKKLARTWHPDRNNSSEESTVKMQEINMAFEFVERHISNPGGAEDVDNMSSGDENGGTSDHEEAMRDEGEKKERSKKNREKKRRAGARKKNHRTHNTSMDSDDEDESDETRIHREFLRKLEEEKQFFREQKEKMRRSTKKRGWKNPEERKRPRGPGALSPGEDNAVDSLDSFDECTHSIAVAIRAGLSLVFVEQVMNMATRGQALILDDDLNMPLHYAARYSKNSIIQMCINMAGEDWPSVVLQKNKSGLTARDIAEAEMRFHNDEATKVGEVPSMPPHNDEEEADRQEATPQIRAYIAYRLRELQQQAEDKIAERERKSQRKFDPMRTVYMLFVFTASYFLLNFMAQEYVGWTTLLMCLVYAIVPATVVSARLLLILFTLLVMAPTILYYMFLPLFWIYDWGWWSILPLVGMWLYFEFLYGIIKGAFFFMANTSAIVILQYIVWQEKATNFSLKCLTKLDITGWIAPFLQKQHRIANSLLEAYERVFEAVIFGALLLLLDLVWQVLCYLGFMYSVLVIFVCVLIALYWEGAKMTANNKAMVNRASRK